jgi:hypothetical protein
MSSMTCAAPCRGLLCCRDPQFGTTYLCVLQSLSGFASPVECVYRILPKGRLCTLPLSFGGAWACILYVCHCPHQSWASIALGDHPNKDKRSWDYPYHMDNPNFNWWLIEWSCWYWASGAKSLIYAFLCNAFRAFWRLLKLVTKFLYLTHPYLSQRRTASLGGIFGWSPWALVSFQEGLGNCPWAWWRLLLCNRRGVARMMKWISKTANCTLE